MQRKVFVIFIFTIADKYKKFSNKIAFNNYDINNGVPNEFLTYKVEMRAKQLESKRTRNSNYYKIKKPDVIDRCSDFNLRFSQWNSELKQNNAEVNSIMKNYLNNRLMGESAKKHLKLYHEGIKHRHNK